MRRSICYCEPNHALAGEMNTWEFHYTTATSLPKGTLLRFDLVSDGREIDWELPSVNLKKTKNVIYAKVENGKVIPATEVEIPDTWAPVYEFTLPAKVDAGATISIIVGSPKLTGNLRAKNGTQTQTYAQRRRPFLLHIDPTGKRHFGEAEVFSMDIKGNTLCNINILTPSFVTRNKRFDITVRFEDEFGNLTSDAPEDTLIELSYENLRENLNWRLFVPETGFITLPNLYFNDIGIYTITLTNLQNKETFRSSPIKCFNDNSHHLYWGLLHGESTKIDSTENIESCLRHFRDEKAFNFFGTSCFENAEETPNDIWKLITQNVAEFDEPDRFSTFLGFQWKGKAKAEGLRQFVFAKDNKHLLRAGDGKNNALKKIYKTVTPKDLLSIPCFTMGKGMEFDFKDFNPEFERVVEIYNSWGSSECAKKAGNTHPINGPVKTGVQEAAEGSIVEALCQNKRFGFVAGGLDDRGTYAPFFEGDQEQYTSGLTAIIAPEHTRAALFEALQNRSCYATTGARIIIGMNIAGVSMGGETNTIDKHGLNINRHLAGYVAGTKQLKLIEIIRNGKVIQTFKPQDYHFEYAYDDMCPLIDVAIDAKDKAPPFVFYYLRVTQEDGHVGWSSPIWVDYIPGKALVKRSKTMIRPPKKPLEALGDDDDDAEDDFDDLENDE